MEKLMEHRLLEARVVPYLCRSRQIKIVIRCCNWVGKQLISEDSKILFGH